MKRKFLYCLCGTLSVVCYAAFQSDSLSEFIQYAVGWSICINLLILSGFHISKKEADAKDDIHKDHTIKTSDTRKITYHKIFNVAGVTFPCNLDASFNRQEVLEYCHSNSKFSLKEYRYKDNPALMIVFSDQHLDIGSVPACLVDRFIKYLNYDYDLRIKEIDSFENEKGKEIYCCKMQLVVYKKEAV